MVGWYHRFNGHEFEQTQGDSEGQQSLVCCSAWDGKESDTTEWLNNNNDVKNRQLVGTCCIVQGAQLDAL